MTHQTVDGKHLLLATLRHEPTNAVPWVPFAGVHAGKLKGYTAREVLTDCHKLVESLLAVNTQYQPDGQPVLFDLQVEAEILGCELVWADRAPPSVASHPLAFKTDIPTHLPEPTEGRLPMILETMRIMKQAVGDHTALYGLICGPFTLASHLRGTEIFMDMYENEAFLDSLLEYTAKVNQRMAELYIEAGMDVIAVVDPLVSQISPKHFRRLLNKPVREIFDFIRTQGVFSSYFVCGDATKNIEEMCLTSPDSIGIDENIDMVKAKAITDHYNIAIGGNIPLTSAMLLGTQQDNMKFVVDLLAKLRSTEHGLHNFILAPGCDMPYDTPVENVVGVLQAVRDPDTVGKALAHYTTRGFDIQVNMPDYAALSKPLVEVFTIDSATCAACGYMVSAVAAVKQELGDQMEYIEHKILEPENIARVMKLGLKNLPAIVINGQLRFSSIIPSKKELIAAIEEAAGKTGE
ncbi:MAG: uroporphyrinogen decarboxylase family protein [Anaerolineae bacterium]|nr:thioredoxin family protein [Thermoflexales bacterium]MDW8407031.1 uroporphyrinogen decarboxylase family protein [Anaerolineae bacterium]